MPDLTRDEAERLPPIERDEAMNRDYIPLPGGWEIQTKGNGSTFRVLDRNTGERYIVVDRDAPAWLTKMAHDVRAAVLDAMTRATPIWYPIETLVHEHIDDRPLTVDGKVVPATYTSDPVILTNGKRVWVERSVIIGGARSSSADKFTAYPSGDKPTHWMPLPAAPEAP